MAHTREALQRQLQVERASFARMKKWSDFQKFHQREMITKCGFSIEPVGMYEEEFAQLGYDAELELLKKEESSLASPTPEQWTQAVDFSREKGVKLAEFRCDRWKIIPAPVPDNAKSIFSRFLAWLFG